MPIRFACPNCRTTYAVRKRDAGKKAECKTCGQRLQVPGPSHSRTILGEVLPEHGTETPTRQPAPSAGPGPIAPEPTPAPSFRPVAPSGPIRFDCPNCRTTYTVNRMSAGKAMDCRSCGSGMTVPAVGSASVPVSPTASAALLTPPTVPEAIEASLPTERIPRTSSQQVPAVRGWEDPEPDPDEPEAEPDLYPSRYERPNTNRPVNRMVAGIGTGLLFIGLFLPMVHGPMGFWMSFIDVPWKAVTAGFAIADEIAESKPSRDPEPRSTTKTPDRTRPDPPKGAVLASLVVIASVLYPLFVLGVVGFSTFLVAAGRSAKPWLFMGIATVVATLGYALAILLLSTISELRFVMALVSPGFGWAVLLIGALMVLIAGVIHPGRVERDFR
jgi:transcription elongation factor Elf1